MKTHMLRAGLVLAGLLAAVPGHAQQVSLTANCATISGTNNMVNFPSYDPPMDIRDGPVVIATVQPDSSGIFSLPTPAALKDNQPHQITAKVEGNMWYTSSPFALTCPVNAPGYAYDYTDKFTSINSSIWQANGVAPTPFPGFTNSSSSGSAVIYKPPVPGVANEYEVKMTLALLSAGGVYSSYIHASTNALESPNQGSYYVVELQNPMPGGTGTLAVYQVVSGSATLVASTAVPCHNGMTVRSIFRQDGYFWIYVDNWFWLCSLTTAVPSGQPGVGVRSAPAGNAIVEVDIGHWDTVAPSAPNMTTMSVSTAPNRVDLKWAGTADDANGTGVAMYWVGRDGSQIGWVTDPEYEDNTVTPGTTHTYEILSCDYHQNYASTGWFTVTVPPSGSIDPRRVGVAALAPTWGGTGENIDMRSGNLNYTVPLLKPVGLGGLSVPVNLTYNSQFWHQDSGTTWRMANSTGYGIGWMIQAGSLTPVYDNLTWNAPLYYLFVDATGAEYRLDQVSNGVYSSTQSIYVWFDTNTHRLWFKDGTYWTFGCVSGGTEPDAGTMYPTLIQDQLGNFVSVSYQQGTGTAWPNSSSRITWIEDSRAAPGDATYVFDYGLGGVLTAVQNTVGSNENYMFAFTPQAVNIVSPFDGSFSTNAIELTSVTQGIGMLAYATTFSYDSSGELTKVNLPHGGYLRWTYTTQGYTGSRSLREVQNRYLEMAAGGNTEYTYTLARPSGDSGYSFHTFTTLTDVTANAQKVWSFWVGTGGGQLNAAWAGFDEITINNPSYTHSYRTYAQDAAGNWYVNALNTFLNYGLSDQVEKTTTQVDDRYGNPTQIQQYDWGANTPTRTTTNTWLEGPDGSPLPSDARYVRNRLLSSTVTDGSNTVTLVSNSYTSPNLLISSTTPTTSTSYTYDSYGNVTGQTTNGLATSITMDPSHNYVVPSSITTGSSSASLQWSPFLGLTNETGQNGDSAQISYSNGFPVNTTSPYGATTNNWYTVYSGTGTPSIVVSVTNNHFTRQTMDGVGHVILQETGTVSGSTYTTVSQVSSVYAPCGCSPMGKLQKVSQPYAPGGTPVYTVYAYDGLGRTVSVTLPDGSVTHYVYDNRATTDPVASFVDITDPAGKRKRYQMDGFGHLTRVVEDPNGVAYATTYSYDVMDHLIQVQQTRSGTTQTRTFNYMSGTTLTGYLQSATNPENGTVSYTYNSDGTLATKTDAKGVVTGYTYDSQKRLLTFGVKTNGVITPAYTYTYDSSPGGTNQMGRLATVSYTNPASGDQFADTYSYTAAGAISTKGLQITRNAACTPSFYQYCMLTSTLSMSYQYDSEGHRTQMTLPAVAYGSPSYGSYTNSWTTTNYSYDQMERPVGMTDAGSGNAYVNGVQYGTSNEMLQISYTGTAGQGLTTETRTYNSLLQLTGVTRGTVNLTYGYTASQNNGKIASATNNASGEQVVYQYDALNRLIEAHTLDNQNVTQWGQGFVYL